MSYTLPITASAVTGTEWLQALDDAVEALAAMFYGTSAPTHKNGRLWCDTTTAGAPKVKMSLGGSWHTLFDDADQAGGGLVRAVAGAFTTLAPTSAVAATAADELTRKNEVDARVLATGAAFIGSISATATIPLWETPALCDIVDVRLVSWGAGLATSGSAYYVFEVWNATAGNALQGGTVGTPPTGTLLTASTYTGGTAFVADTWRSLSVDQNNVGIAANSSIQLRTTKVGSPAALTIAAAIIRYRVRT